MSSTEKNSNNNQVSIIKEDFQRFISDKDHPCIMAKTAVKLDRVEIHNYCKMGSIDTAESIYKDILNYIENHDFESKLFESFIAVFSDEDSMDEKQFEFKLWRQLSLIHHVDKKTWDNSVSDNPNDPDFSFSIGGKAFYVIGLHPNSSRAARQFRYPAFVFNFHHQFEKLREMGTFKKVRNTIRERDHNKNGSINPMLKDFGMESEAKQYSGRQDGKTWECPFKNNESRK